jgi:hypothetical protein
VADAARARAAAWAARAPTAARAPAYAAVATRLVIRATSEAGSNGLDTFRQLLVKLARDAQSWWPRIG